MSWLAPSALLAIAGGSFVAYNTASAPIAGRVVYLYACSLILGPSLVWVFLRRRGVPAVRALAGAYVVPLAWIAKECIALGRFFGAGEALYYAVNPLALGIVAAVGFQLAVCELVLRRVRTGRWQLLGGPALVLYGLLSLGAAYGVVARAYGVTAAHYAYLDVYRAIFGN